MKGTTLRRTDARPTLCILVPVCNEEGNLASLREKLEELHCSLKTKYRVEYCIVDDGSSDATPFLIGSAAPEGAKCTVVSHVANRGVGAAFRTGFAHAKADIVCTIDADCSYAPAEMTRLLDVIARGEADVVVASPYHPEGAVEGVQRWRLLLSLNCSLLYRAATPLKLHTYTSIFRAYRRNALQKVTFPSDGFVAAVEILLSAASQGFRVREVPATLSRRTAGVSKMRLLRTIRTHVGLLSRCCAARLAGGYPTLAHGQPAQQATMVTVRVANSLGRSTGSATHAQAHGSAGSEARIVRA